MTRRTTKKVRHQIYVETLRIFSNWERCTDKHSRLGLCSAIEDALYSLKIVGSAPYPYSELNKYKEIWDQKPDNLQGSYWFPHHDPDRWEKRVKILKQAIELTK